MPNRNSTLAAYGETLSRWSKKLGPKPTKELLETVHEELGVRRGSKAALALAMYMRPEGATAQQVVQVIGTPQNNKRRELIANGKLDLASKGERDSNNHLVYKVQLPQTRSRAKA